MAIMRDPNKTYLSPEIIDSESVHRVRKRYQMEIAPGKFYRQLDGYFLPENAPIWGPKEHLMNLNYKEVQGVQIHMPTREFMEMVSAAEEAHRHRTARATNPACQEAYEQYMTLYRLTRVY